MSLAEERQLLAGWGRAGKSAARLVSPSCTQEAEKVLAALGNEGGRPAIARGLGRSYGDAAQCGGGTVIDCRGLTAPFEISPSGLCRAGGGLSIDSLLERAVPAGWFVPVTPGTRQVTVGGAIASDVHGKNHHVDGAFAAHLRRLELVAPTGRILCGPEDPAFAASCGGMGLTGVITEATFQLIPIESSRIKVETERAGDLDACMALLAERAEEHRYSVAWVDGLAGGRKLGRSVVTRGDHARPAELPAGAAKDPLAYRPRQRFRAPLAPPLSPLSPATIALMNEVWYRKAPRTSKTSFESIASFFHPLDAVGDWNLLYGTRGFIQYQYVVPFGAEEVVRDSLERLGRAGHPPYLVVLKTFGPPGQGHLSFPREGWTLALDLPLGRAGLAEVLDGLDELVAEAGGRVYLTKDSRLRPELLEQMYPRLPAWREEARRLDPDGIMSSDLDRRLGLRRSPEKEALGK